MRRVPTASLASGMLLLLGGRQVYRVIASGAVTVDVGIGRRVRVLGPLAWEIAADRETVFDVIARPYLGRTPRFLHDKLRVWERATDMVLAEHLTQVERGVTTTLETVRFERPDRIHFRLVRGPVPHVQESFVLDPVEGGTRLVWEGSSAQTSGRSVPGGVTGSPRRGSTPSVRRWARSSTSRSDAPRRASSGRYSAGSCSASHALAMRL